MTVGFIGAGHMGGAMLRGLAASPLSPRLLVFDAAPGRAAQLAASIGPAAAAADSASALVSGSDVVVLAVRPADLPMLLDELRTARPASSHLFLSIAAGRTTSWLEERLPPASRVVRAMPNLGVSVWCGASAFCGGTRATQADLDAAQAILSSFGIAVRLPEKDLNTVTALSGSGPAFVAWALQAMIDGATALGLPVAAANALALQTLLGTAKVLTASGAPSVPDFIAAVATPGGTTAAGTDVLDASGARAAFASTIAAAAERAARLAAQ